MAKGISAEFASARAANEQRYAQMMNIYNQVIARAQPGGAFQKAGLAQIEAAKTKGVGQETQQMISSGMYGTTTTAGIPARWEAEVGAPARLRLEDVMEQRLTQAQLGKAGAIERREDVYPDVGAVAQYTAQAAAAAPQQSLSDWMAKEFGTISGGVRRATPTAAPARRTAPAGYTTPTKVGAVTRATTPTPTYTPPSGKAFTTTPERKGFEVPIKGKVPTYFETISTPTTKPTYYPDPWTAPGLDYDPWATKKKKTGSFGGTGATGSW
jgi:hypothetical protein